MLRRTLLTVVTVLALAGVAAAQSGNFIVTLKNADAIGHIETRYKAEVLGQVGDAPVFLIHVEGKNAARQLLRDRLVLDVEEDRIVTLDGKGISSNGNAAAKSLSEKGKKGKKSKKSGKKNRSGDDPTEGSGEDPVLNQSTMALFQSTMALFGDHPVADFFGTEVLEAYSQQDALDLIRVSDIRHLATGAGTRIAFIDTGADYDHPALRPWLYRGIDLLGTGSASELSGIDQSTMALFEDFARKVGHGPTIDQSTMALFFRQLQRLALDQSTMALFWQALGNLGLDQSTMFLFWERLTTADLDQSTMALFWKELQELGLDQSTMFLFMLELEKVGVDQSTMALFWELTEKMYLDQSTMALFKDDGKLWDSFGHGTLVAGLLHVVAPEARLVPIRAFDAQGQSTLFLTMAAVYAAIGRDVDVINMSFSIGKDSKAFSRVLNLAWSRGISLVASVGNNGEDAGEVYPAAYPIVIGVTATDLDDRIADFANYGRSVSVAAPGVGVVTTFPGGLYARASGTSFSAPIVA